MDSLLTLAFEAHHAQRNHHRHYEVRIGRDLLDDWTVTIRYGRTGQHGQERRYGSPEPEALRAIIRDRLRRRLSAPKRIGCSYRLCAMSEAPGFDATAWLPADVLERFVAPASPGPLWRAAEVRSLP
jgi:predicted DNA-binding WGR domain protein